jgi:hypothetical protein
MFGFLIKTMSTSGKRVASISKSASAGESPKKNLLVKKLVKTRQLSEIWDPEGCIHTPSNMGTRLRQHYKITVFYFQHILVGNSDILTLEDFFFWDIAPCRLLVSKPTFRRNIGSIYNGLHGVISQKICLFSLMAWDWVHLVVRPLPGLLYQPQMIDDGDCGATSGMKICRENRSTRRKPAPVPLYPSQIPHDLTRARTRVAAVGSQRLTAWVGLDTSTTEHTAFPARLSRNLITTLTELSWMLELHRRKLSVSMYPIKLV